MIREFENKDYERVRALYEQGIRSKIATFQIDSPTYEEWDKSHLKIARLVEINNNNEILGWVALSPISSRIVYRGVAEVSIYIDENHRGKQIGTKLLNAVIAESEKNRIWTLQSGIFEINKASIALHSKCGFRLVGIREKIARDSEGHWQNTVLMERRSQIVGMV